MSARATPVGARVGRRRLVAAAVVIVLAISLIAAARASAGWSPAFELSAVSGTAEFPQAAVDPSGGAILVWSGSDQGVDIVQLRRVDASGTPGRVQDVSEPGASSHEPQVAVDPGGNATVAWIDSSTPDGMVRARRVTAGGALGDSGDISPVGQSAADPQIAVDPAGRATVVWSAFDGATDAVFARRIDAAGGLGPVLHVSAQGETAFRQQVAVDPAGNTFVAWQGVDGPNSVVRARVLDADGALRPSVTLSGDGDRAFAPQIAVDATGIPTGAWLRSDGTVQLRRGAAGGGLGAIADVSAADVTGGVQLAVDGFGDATVVWPGFDGTNETVELRRLDADGTLGTVAHLSSGGDDSEPQVGVDDVGNATVIWLHRSDAASTVRSRTVPRGGEPGPAVDLSAASEDTVTPRLATDRAGNSTAVWSRYVGSRHVIEGARFVMPPPLPTPPPVLPPAALVPAAVTPAAPALGTSSGCATVTLRHLRSDRAGRPGRKRARTKGVGARLVLDRPAHLQVLETSLSYAMRGRRKNVRLTNIPTSGGGTRRALRFRLPARLGPKLRLNARVTFKLKLRARSTGPGCTFGKVSTFTLRTKLIWVARV